MAEKRMFAKSIVLSDAFLDMPLSARCLYFTLGMLADDDGFVGAPKSIMRQCGASHDDLGILIAKRYVLTFDSGVIVIKHWRINNYLRNDRYAETTYLEEKRTLTLDGKGAYTEAEFPAYDELPEPPEQVNAEREDMAEVMTYYMENITKAVPSGVTTAAIQGFVREMGKDVVLHAMRIAAESEKHDWRYVRTILQRYRDNGLLSLEAVLEDEEKYKTAKAGRGKGEPKYSKNPYEGW